MKLVKTSLVALLLASALCASAQEKINMIKAGGNLLTLLYGDDGDHSYGGASVAMEHQLGTHSTLVFGANYNARERSSLSNGFSVKERYTILTFEPEIRWYPRTITEGFYWGLAPSLMIRKSKITGNGLSIPYDRTHVGGAVKLGYQFLLIRALSLQFGTGVGLVFPSSEASGELQINLNVLAGYQF